MNDRNTRQQELHQLESNAANTRLAVQAIGRAIEQKQQLQQAIDEERAIVAEYQQSIRVGGNWQLCPVYIV